jgi:hypothetical protein
MGRCAANRMGNSGGQRLSQMLIEGACVKHLLAVQIRRSPRRALLHHSIISATAWGPALFSVQPVRQVLNLAGPVSPAV